MKLSAALSTVLILGASNLLHALPMQDAQSEDVNSEQVKRAVDGGNGQSIDLGFGIAKRVDDHDSFLDNLSSLLRRGKDKGKGKAPTIEEIVRGRKTRRYGRDGWQLSDTFFLFEHDGRYYALDVFDYDQERHIATSHLAAAYPGLDSASSSSKQPYVGANRYENGFHRDWSGNSKKPTTIEGIMEHLKFPNPPGTRRGEKMTHEEFMPASLKPADDPDEERFIQGAFVPGDEQGYQGRTLQRNNRLAERIERELGLHYRIRRYEYHDGVPHTKSSRFPMFREMYKHYQKYRFYYDTDKHFKGKNLERYQPLYVPKDQIKGKPAQAQASNAEASSSNAQYEYYGNWVRIPDTSGGQTHGQYYWYNTIDGSRQWTKPSHQDKYQDNTKHSE